MMVARTGSASFKCWIAFLIVAYVEHRIGTRFSSGCIIHSMRKLACPCPSFVPRSLVAQEAETVLKVDVNVVNILFSVRDKKGALVPNLQKEDFTVLEDGKSRPSNTSLVKAIYR